MMRFFTSDLRRNLTKIVCLTFGLALGFILVAKVYTEESFDTYLPDAARTYVMKESIVRDGEYGEYSSTSGGVAPALKRVAPQVEAATRSTGLVGEATMRLADGRTFDIEGIRMADSCHFDVFPRQIIAGDPHEVLAVKRQCMIPRSLAEAIGGDVVGLDFTVPELSGSYHVTIAGVYEDYPVNASTGNPVLLSLATIPEVMGDGREFMWGNDRYRSYVRLAEGADTAAIPPLIHRMLVDALGAENIAQTQYDLHLRPIVGEHVTYEGLKTMIWVLLMLAVVLMMSAALNYLLIVLGQAGRRSREMAVRKCYGTSNFRIFLRVMGESAFFLVVSAILAVLIVLCLNDECRRLLGYSAEELLTVRGVWAVGAGVCAALLVITGVLPAWYYCRTPVAHAFRPSRRGARVWKLALLSVQFFAAGLLVCLLSLAVRQYSLLSNSDMGYEYDNLAIADLQGLEPGTRTHLAEELRRLGCVRSVASAYQDFSEMASGNNVWLRTSDDYQNVNVADMEGANPEIIETMGFRLVEGSNFSEHADTTVHEVIVEENFRDVFAKLGDTSGELVGKSFFITGHVNPITDAPSEYTIVGVIEHISRGGFANWSDERAGVYFPMQDVYGFLYVRFGQLSAETLAEAQAVIDRVVTERPVYITPFRTRVEGLNAPVRNFGTSVTAVGLAIVVIALIGLAGYTADEVNRRAREIAVRKVNGSTAGQILRLFCRDILVVALPSLLLGGVVAVIVGNRWLEQFTIRVGVAPVVMGAMLVTLLAVILGVVAINSWRIARSNPVEYLRAE